MNQLLGKPTDTRNSDLTSLIEYAKRKMTYTVHGKNMNVDVKNGALSAISNIFYYVAKQSDRSFIAFVVKHEENKARELMNSQNFDKKLVRQNRGKLMLFAKLQEIL